MEKTVQVKQCVELIGSGSLPGVKFTKPSAAIKIAQIMQAARVIVDAYNTQRQELAEEYAITNDDGTLASNPDGTLKFANGAKRRTFEQKQRELLDAETTVMVPALTDEDLQASDLTPLAIFPLLPFTNLNTDW